MDSRNRVATELVDEAIDFADELGVGIHHLGNEAVVLDFGVKADGGIEAGLLLAEIATGGLATLQTGMADLPAASVPAIELSTDHPALALLEMQLAEWSLDVDDGVGYGPATLFRDRPSRAIDYEEDFDFAVLPVRNTALPDADLAGDIAEAAGVPSSGVFLPTAPTASIAGMVEAVSETAARAVEALVDSGYDPTSILTATGSAPLPPIPSEGSASDHARRAIIGAGQAHLVVRHDEVDLSGLRESDAGWLPARITVDVLGGQTYRSGDVDESAFDALFDR